MKMLVICQYYRPEPFRISDICEELTALGHQVTVVTGLPNYSTGRVPAEYRLGKRRRETLSGVEVHRCFVIGRGRGKLTLFLNYLSFALSGSLSVLSLSRDYDVVLVYQLSPVLMGVPAIVYKWRTGKKILLYCLDLWPDSLAAGGVTERSPIYRLFFGISRWIYSSVDKITVTSKMFVDYFRDVLLLDDREIEHLPQHAEDLFVPEETERNSSQVNLVFAGNVGDMQSVETIVRAAAELKAYEQIVFHIVGDGSRLAKCQQLARSLGLANVMFHGRLPLSEMPRFYAMADAMLVTLKDNRTMSYTLPGKVQSYMAAGKPVIGAINGEARRVIEESECGLCCAAEDHIALSELILEFSRSDLWQQMGANARRYYSEHYRKELFIGSLISAMGDLGGGSHV